MLVYNTSTVQLKIHGLKLNVLLTEELYYIKVNF